MTNSRIPSGNIFSVFHSLPGFYLVVAPDFPHFTIHDATDSFLKEARIERKLVLGADLSSIFCLEADCPDSAGLRDLTVELSQAIRRKKAALVPFYYKFNLGHGAKPGDERLWGISITPQLNKKGEVDFVILNLRDATSKVLTEKREQQVWSELSKSTQYYNALFDGNPDAIFSLNKEGKFISANKALTTLAECTLSDLDEMTFMHLLDPEDLTSTLDHFQQALQGMPRHYEARVVTVKGSRLFLSITNLPIMVDKNITVVAVFTSRMVPSARPSTQPSMEFSRMSL